MKLLILIIFLIQLSNILTCYASDEANSHLFNEAKLSDDDPRLFDYDDSLFINRNLIDSILRSICKERIDPSDRTFLHIEITSEVLNIIELANIFVNDRSMDVIYEHSYCHAPYPIPTRDLYQLYQSFLNIQHIEARDIIDVINIKKKIRHLDTIEGIELKCYTLEQFMDQDDKYGETDSLLFELKKISSKYKYGIIDSVPRSRVCYLFDLPTLSTFEKIEILKCMIEKLNYAYGQYRGYETVFDDRIKRWRQAIDSLQSVNPKCN